MPDRMCSVDGCVKPRQKRGWCGTHYARWLRHGDPLKVLTLHGQPLEDQFFHHVEKGDGHGCWIWTSYTFGGYGSFRHMVAPKTQKSVVAHRWAYEHIVSPIDPELTLDHLCGEPLCVNPGHLEPVTQRVNNLRGDTLAARNAAKTHCPAGHLYDEVNTYIRPTDGGRDCKQCINRRSRERNERRRAARRA